MRRLTTLATVIAFLSFSIGGAAFAQDEGDGGGEQDGSPESELPADEPAATAQGVAGMTCGAFVAADAANRMENLNSILNFAKDPSHSAVVGIAGPLLQDSTPEQMLEILRRSCEGQKDDVNLFSALN